MLNMLASTLNCAYDADGIWSCAETRVLEMATSGSIEPEVGLAIFGGVLAMIGVWITIFIVIGLLIWVPWVIGAWKVMTKAGEAGWKALIPIYNMIIFLKMAGLSPWWVLGIFVSPLNTFVAFYMNIKLAEKFGKGAGYGVLMAFFEPIMYLVLGFGSAQYNKNAGSGDNLFGSPTPAPAPNPNEDYAKKMEIYNAEYAKYEENMKKYNEEMAKKDAKEADGKSVKKTAKKDSGKGKE